MTEKQQEIAIAYLHELIEKIESGDAQLIDTQLRQFHVPYAGPDGFTCGLLTGEYTLELHWTDRAIRNRCIERVSVSDE